MVLAAVHVVCPSSFVQDQLSAVLPSAAGDAWSAVHLAAAGVLAELVQRAQNLSASGNEALVSCGVCCVYSR